MLIFETDCFFDYEIGYKDKAIAQLVMASTNNLKKTKVVKKVNIGQHTNLMLYGMTLIILILAYVFVIYRRKN